MKLFIVDDSAVLRQHLIDVLSGFKKIEIIGEAQDSIQAINSIQSLQPDVVILDIRMPGGGGIDVLKKIKKNETSPIIIMFTNYPYPQYRQKCVDAGADFFFDKSTESEKMIKLLEQLEKDFSRSRLPHIKTKNKDL